MTTSLDSSALVPVYVPERFSKAAHKAVKTAGQRKFDGLSPNSRLYRAAIVRIPQRSNADSRGFGKIRQFG